MNRRNIRKVAVLGSGVMGSRIACHFANIGVAVLLLDLPPKTLSPEEEAKGFRLSDRSVRNRIAIQSLESALRSHPSPIYQKALQRHIRVGNFEDDLKEIESVDWILEAVVERLDIKKQVFEQVERFRKPGTLVTSNTSGIPIHLIAADRSADFRQHFCGTHFFNPPRYLPLLEIIPFQETKTEITQFLLDYGDRFLGKTTVLCKDTPAFIGNRVGMYAMLAVCHLVEQFDLTIEEADQFTGTAMGHPKSATFRTVDLVGLDTLIHVAQGLSEQLHEDESRTLFNLPHYMLDLFHRTWLGDKTRQGFYKKIKDEQGNAEILVFDLKEGDYRKQRKVESSTMQTLKGQANLEERLRSYAAGTDRAAQFFRALHDGLFEYVSRRIPEISDDLFRIDDAMRAGFGWELGPFEIWDILGVRATLKNMEQAEKRLPGQSGKVAPWVYEFLEAGHTTFYQVKDGKRWFYDLARKDYREIPGTEGKISLRTIRTDRTIWENSGLSVIDLGDGILLAEIHTKMNTIDADVITGIHQAIDLAETTYQGLVIGQEGTVFSAGANLGMILSLAFKQDWEGIEEALWMFQQLSLRIRYSAIPVVAAPFNLCLGGGCEFAMHADFVQLHAETYMGLVEFGVGLIPGGGGTKEFAIRISEAVKKGQIAQQALREHFLTIAQAKVSGSALEAVDLAYLEQGKFAISMQRNRLLADAKAKALELARAGYQPPLPGKDVLVLGKQGLGTVYVGTNTMLAGYYISEYDQLMAEKLGWVLCGGDLSSPTEVTETYLLELERQAFLMLVKEEKTLTRIQHMLTTGKPLRN